MKKYLSLIITLVLLCSCHRHILDTNEREEYRLDFNLTLVSTTTNGRYDKSGEMNDDRQGCILITKDSVKISWEDSTNVNLAINKVIYNDKTNEYRYILEDYSELMINDIDFSSSRDNNLKSVSFSCITGLRRSAFIVFMKKRQ